MKKLIGVILSVAIIFCCAVAGQASGRIIKPRWEQLADITCDLEVDGRTVNVYCSASTEDEYTIRLSVELQRDNGGWKKVKSWTGEDQYSCVIKTKYSVSSGYGYRLKMVAKVYEGKSVIESVTRYSETVNV